MLCVNRPVYLRRCQDHDITTCTVVRCLVQKERALLQELSNRWKLYGVCMRFHTQDDLTQESKTMRIPPKIFQRFNTGFKISQDSIIYTILHTQMHPAWTKKVSNSKAWCLWSQVSVLDGEEDQAIRDEIGRLVRQDIELNMWGKSGWPCRLMQAERSCAVSVTCLLNMKTGKVKTTGLLLESTLAGNSWRLCRLHELILWFESP